MDSSVSGRIEFTDFRPVASVPGDLVERYLGRVSDDMLEVWQTQGFGTAANGFIKIIDPDEYGDRLSESLPDPALIPLFATGLGDVIAWNGENFRNLKFRYGIVNGMGSNMRTLPIKFSNASYLDEVYSREPYSEAVEKHGELAFDECFGYVPLLALGGPERVENLKKGLFGIGGVDGDVRSGGGEIGRGLSMMEVPTQPIRKTSTCTTLPSTPLT